MPSFDPIGFGVPFLVALMYSARTVFHMRGSTQLLLAAAGGATYAFPIAHDHGVGIVPSYLLVVFGFMCTGSWRPQWLPRALPPAGVVLALSFASVAIPDCALTWQRGGGLWIVGGAGLDDALVKFWLWFALPIAAAWLILDRLSTRAPWRQLLRYHLSPSPAADRQRIKA